MFSDLRKISTALEHGFCIRARRTSAVSSIERRMMTIEVRLKTQTPMHFEVVRFWNLMANPHLGEEDSTSTPCWL
jgi:hypothetical protein